MCKQCETNPVYEFTNKRKLCSSCFVKYFQKKVFYTIRKFRMIKEGDVIGDFKSAHFRTVVLNDILKMIGKERDIQLVNLPRTKDTLRNISRKAKIDKLAWASTLDLEAEFIIDELIEGEEDFAKDAGPVEDLTKNIKIIKPLYFFLDEEVLLYAKIRKLKFKQKKEKKDKIEEFIDELEKKHPEIKRAIVNSFLKLKN